MKIFDIFKRKKEIKEPIVEKEIIEENIACSQFAEAVDKGIVSRNKLFSLNGIDYHTFKDGLTMVSAHRYLHYQEHLRFYESNGINKEVSLDYMKDVMDKVVELKDLLYDEALHAEKINEIKNLGRVWKYHYDNFNLEAAMCEMCAITLLNPVENPYLMDYGITARKARDFSLALKGDNADEFAVFFWKLSSLSEFSWTRPLISSMNSTEMTKKTEEENNIMRNSLVLEIQDSLDSMDNLKSRKASSKPVKLLRLLWNLTALQYKSTEFWTGLLKEN